MTESPNLSDETDRQIRAGWVDELQALHAGAVRPPDGKSVAPEGLDGEVLGTRGSHLRMRDMDSTEGPLHQPP